MQKQVEVVNFDRRLRADDDLADEIVAYAGCVESQFIVALQAGRRDTELERPERKLTGWIDFQLWGKVDCRYVEGIAGECPMLGRKTQPVFVFLAKILFFKEKRASFSVEK